MNNTTPTVKQMARLLDSKFTGVFDDLAAGETLSITASEVSLVCRFVARDWQGDLTAQLSRSGHEGALDNLNRAMGESLVRLSLEHEDVGIAWLWANRLRMNLGLHERRVLRSIGGIRLVGVALSTKALRPRTAPIYQVRGENGQFSYEAWAWQSGIEPRVV